MLRLCCVYLLITLASCQTKCDSSTLGASSCSDTAVSAANDEVTLLQVRREVVKSAGGASTSSDEPNIKDGDGPLRDDLDEEEEIIEEEEEEEIFDPSPDVLDEKCGGQTSNEAKASCACAMANGDGDVKGRCGSLYRPVFGLTKWKWTCRYITVGAEVTCKQFDPWRAKTSAKAQALLQMLQRPGPDRDGKTSKAGVGAASILHVRGEIVSREGSARMSFQDPRGGSIKDDDGPLSDDLEEEEEDILDEEEDDNIFDPSPEVLDEKCGGQTSNEAKASCACAMANGAGDVKGRCRSLYRPVFGLTKWKWTCRYVTAGTGVTCKQFDPWRAKTAEAKALLQELQRPDQE